MGRARSHVFDSAGAARAREALLHARPGRPPDRGRADHERPAHGDGSTDMSYETLRYEHDGHVVTLTYDRPDQHNAVSRTMNRELHQAWQRFCDDESAFVLVIMGAGETTFCAGWDLADAAGPESLGDWEAFRVSLYNSPGECGYTRRADIFKPVTAAVNGYASRPGSRRRCSPTSASRPRTRSSGRSSGGATSS